MPLSEIELLARLISSSQEAGKHVVLPNGDDAAVIRVGSELLAVSVDAIVEGRHFSLEYFSPAQVGSKAIESAASDIVAVGGIPEYVLITLSLGNTCDEKIVEEIYKGVNAACHRLDCVVLGGDLVSGTLGIELGISVLGRVASENHLCPRSGAREGDLIFVTGPLGGSAAGLSVFQHKLQGEQFESAKKAHLEPRCRRDLIEKLAPFASAMIDVSDGLSSELYHLASQSRCGVQLNEDKIPIHSGARAVAAQLDLDALRFAYDGGEDYELIYTISSADRKHAIGAEIGEIQLGSEVRVQRGGKLLPLVRGGFDHFLNKSSKLFK